MEYHFYDRETFEYTRSEEVKEGRIPVTGNQEALPAFDPDSQKVFWNQFTGQWQVLSLKEWTEYLIGIGVRTRSEKEKVDADGRIVPKTREELIAEGIISKESVLSSKLSEISEKAKSKIEAGFESNAKGQWYIYDSALEDQFNIKTLIDLGQDVILRCTKKSSGIKDFYPHTNAQLAQVAAEFTNFKMTVLMKSHEFKTAVQNKTNALEIDQFAVNY